MKSFSQDNKVTPRWDCCCEIHRLFFLLLLFLSPPLNTSKLTQICPIYRTLKGFIFVVVVFFKFYGKSFKTQNVLSEDKTHSLMRKSSNAPCALRNVYLNQRALSLKSRENKITHWRRINTIIPRLSQPLNRVWFSPGPYAAFLKPVHYFHPRVIQSFSKHRLIRPHVVYRETCEDLQAPSGSLFNSTCRRKAAAYLQRKQSKWR